MPRRHGRIAAIMVPLILGLFALVRVGGPWQPAPSGREEHQALLDLPSPGTWEPHPTSTLHLHVLAYRYYTVGYDEEARNPAWVRYLLSGPVVHQGREHRPPTFATEFRTAAQVSDHDYTRSGFDRGHMCPAHAMFSRHGEAGLQSTFIMSNVIPQRHGLNAGLWERLEDDIAGRPGHDGGWAARYGPLEILDGPVYGQRPAVARLGNGTWIPIACYSVILRHWHGHWDAIAVEMPNRRHVPGPVSRYLTTIAAIRQQTAIDLLAGMPDNEKLRLEQERTTGLWR